MKNEKEELDKIIESISENTLAIQRAINAIDHALGLAPIPCEAEENLPPQIGGLEMELADGKAWFGCSEKFTLEEVKILHKHMYDYPMLQYSYEGITFNREDVRNVIDYLEKNS